MTKRFRIQTLGCRTNQYEAEGFRTQLEAMGWQAAAQGETADLCLVNSCTVTDAADRQSAYDVRQLVKNNPGAKVVVTGCAAERDPSRFGEGVIAFGNREKETLLAQLFPEESVPEFVINRFEAHTRAFVKVQDGCNSFCTYCIIPYVRGRSKSRTIDEVVREVRGLVENGYAEVVLTGINIGDFEDEGKRLVDLVKAVDQIDGLKRLRLSSIDPDEVDEPLQEAILSGRTTCPSLHLVLQSGSNMVLKRMNRKYTRQIFQQTVERLRNKSPDFTFTTDVIVGFPGETEEDHRQTLSVIEETQFAKVHMFPYSPRERTRAALYEGRVPQDVMRERKQEVQVVAEQAAYRLREKYVGRVMEILCEGNEGGHTANFLQVLYDGAANQLLHVRLTENSAKGLHGVLDSH